MPVMDLEEISFSSKFYPYIPSTAEIHDVKFQAHYFLFNRVIKDSKVVFMSKVPNYGECFAIPFLSFILNS